MAVPRDRAGAVVSGATVTVRRNRRALYRAVAALPGWLDSTAPLDTVKRLETAPAGTVDYSGQVAIIARTRRTVTLGAL